MHSMRGCMQRLGKMSFWGFSTYTGQQILFQKQNRELYFITYSNGYHFRSPPATGNYISSIKEAINGLKKRIS